jgi:hypothetical protein
MKIRLIIAWVCNLVDTAATLDLIRQYVDWEINPISAWLLQWPPVFAAVKLVVMSIAVAFCWWQRNWRLCKAASWVLCVEYLAVAVYYMIVYAVLL